MNLGLPAAVPTGSGYIILYLSGNCGSGACSRAGKENRLVQGGMLDGKASIPSETFKPLWKQPRSVHCTLPTLASSWRPEVFSSGLSQNSALSSAAMAN